MTRRQVLGGSPILLYLAAAAFSAELVHVIVYAFEHGLGDGFATAMAFGGHHSWWLVVFAATTVVGGAAVASAATRFKVRDALAWRRFAMAWALLLAVGFVGFLFLENLETAHGDHHPLAGLEPAAWFVQPAVLAAVGSVLAILAFAVTALSPATAIAPYDTTLTRSYAELVGSGVYSADFQHAGWAADFFAKTMSRVIMEINPRRPIRVLECGVGTGFWLGRLHHLVGRDRHVLLHGFDLSPDMVGAARRRLTQDRIPATVAVGDVLDPEAYVIDGEAKHDLVFAYDVVQQLPRRLQVPSALKMFEHVAPGGWLLIFDHDARSRYGRVMGTKKWLRRHLGIPLVPAFYIHAAYPALAPLARRLSRAGAADVRVFIESRGRHRALVAKRPDVGGRSRTMDRALKHR